MKPGWEAWTRTRVPCSKGMCPTAGRPPKEIDSLNHRVIGSLKSCPLSVVSCPQAIRAGRESEATDYGQRTTDSLSMTQWLNEQIIFGGSRRAAVCVSRIITTL